MPNHNSSTVKCDLGAHDQGLAQDFDLGRSSLDTVPRAAILWALLVVAAYAAARSLAYAGAKPFWIDEVLTQVVSRAGNFPAVWRVLSTGVDGNPPLFYLMERVTGSLISNENIGYRLLSLLAFVCTVILLYVFVKTRNGAAPALISACFLLTTALFTFYAAEARPYSLLTGCIAMALVCYQRAPASPWVGAMFVSLLLACSIHYYAVFELLPFFLAELTLVYLTKKIRLKVWVALLAAPVSLVVSLPLLWRMRQNMGGHFWSHYIGPGYSGFFGLGGEWSSALAGTAAVAMLAGLIWTARQPEAKKESSVASLAEMVLVLTLLLLPMIGFTTAKITHVPLVSRYFLPAILGLATAFGYVLARAKPMSVFLAAVLVSLSIGVQEVQFWTSLRHRDAPVEPVASLAETVHHEDLPIVISDINAYLMFWHYASPALRQRLVTLADPASAVIYEGSDTSQKIAEALRSFAPVAVPDFGTFAAQHPVFLLYSNRTEGDWWPVRLAREGHRLQLLAVRGSDTMYLVELKPPHAATD
jgi:4-amino-4-deoxy-L-arabinose transferase-like glycosyltransferase